MRTPTSTKARKVMFAMRTQGLRLCRSFERGWTTWCLSNGEKVDAVVAAIIVADPQVGPAGDGLFAGLSQTFQLKGKNYG